MEKNCTRWTIKQPLPAAAASLIGTAGFSRPGFCLDPVGPIPPSASTLTACFLFAFAPQVKNVSDQEGFGRQKRGYRNLNDIEVNMSDPLFTKQWYLVSNQPSSCLHAGD